MKAATSAVFLFGVLSFYIWGVVSYQDAFFYPFMAVMIVFALIVLFFVKDRAK